MSPKTESSSHRSMACELVAALLKGPHSRADLAAICGMHTTTVDLWLTEMDVSGLVSLLPPAPSYVGRGRKPFRYELNPYPYTPRERAVPAVGVQRVYVAGPMSGLPEHNFPAFNAATVQLRAQGYSVVNPVEVNPDPDASWGECMRADIRELLTCDTVALLPGWERSRGGRLERGLARDLGLQVVELGELVVTL